MTETIAPLARSAELTRAASDAAQAEETAAAADVARLAADLVAAENAYDLDPTDKAGRAVHSARDARALADVRLEAARRRRATAESTAEASEEAHRSAVARVELDGRISAARVELDAAKGREVAALAALDRAQRREHEARLSRIIPSALALAIKALAAAGEDVTRARTKAAEALADVGRNEDELAALDPAAGAELLAQRAAAIEAAEARHAGEVRELLTVPAFVAAFDAQVAPMLRASRELLTLTVAAAGAIVREHEDTAKAHGLPPAHARIGALGRVLAARVLAEGGPVGELLAALRGWLPPNPAAPGGHHADPDAFTRWILRTLGDHPLEHEDDHRCVAVTPVERLVHVLEGRGHLVADIARARRSDGELMGLGQASDHPSNCPAHRASAAWRELSWSREHGRWNGPREVRELHLLSIIAAGVKSLAAQVDGPRPRYAVESTSLPFAPGETREARIANTIGIPLDMVPELPPPTPARVSRLRAIAAEDDDAAVA